MDWKQLGKEVARIGAPLLGGALAGPAGASFGAVLASAFGGSMDDPASLYASMQANPDAAVRLREIERAHEQTLVRLHLQDVADARQRDVAIRQAGSDNRRADGMVWIAFAGVAGCMAAALFASPSEAVFGFIATVGGMFLKHLGTAYDFEFGSSRGSKTKDAEMAALANRGGSQ